MKTAVRILAISAIITLIALAMVYVVQDDSRMPSGSRQHDNTPAESWISFTDTQLRFSLKYPSGWSVEPAVNPGAVTSISSYDPGLMQEEGASSDDVPSGFSKIEIYTEGNTDKLPIDQWVKEKHQRIEEAFGPSAIEPTFRVVEESMYPAIELEVSGDSPAITRYIAVKSQVYILTTVSADVDPRPIFSVVADSFRVSD